MFCGDVILVATEQAVDNMVGGCAACSRHSTQTDGVIVVMVDEEYDTADTVLSSLSGWEPVTMDWSELDTGGHDCRSLLT